MHLNPAGKQITGKSIHQATDKPKIELFSGEMQDVNRNFKVHSCHQLPDSDIPDFPVINMLTESPTIVHRLNNTCYISLNRQSCKNDCKSEWNTRYAPLSRK
ncbi:hypothetical protein DSL64_06755 [Dyadobacter luteus]|uniref:Uncharacterized protein n=1 Tax=Dyadobacter luteus TaxID=2259619 RepID=A0A3D8YDL0_9BACT|nr:hypothetical protein DSL64_06755 [Dyadobacter luteus]